MENASKASFPHAPYEFIISHTFQFERYFSFACPGNLMKYHKGDFAGHCSIYLYIYNTYLYEGLTCSSIIICFGKY